MPEPSLTDEECRRSIETQHFWLSGWMRAARHREKGLILQTTAEYLDRRWQRANTRLAQLLSHS